jgi:hypothetical protein
VPKQKQVTVTRRLRNADHDGECSGVVSENEIVDARKQLAFGHHDRGARTVNGESMAVVLDAADESARADLVAFGAYGKLG